MPQTHEPGAEGEVDFADLWIDLAGVRTKCFLFTMRLSFSGKAVDGNGLGLVSNPDLPDFTLETVADGFTAAVMDFAWADDATVGDGVPP